MPGRRLDIVMANARIGDGRGGSLDQTTKALWQATMDVKLNGAFPATASA